MAINWRFWKDSGRTFFKVQIPFTVDSDALEFAVAKSHRNIKTKADVIDVLKQEIKNSGSPDYWSFNESFEESEISEIRAKARLITEKHFPEAYLTVKSKK